MRGMIEKASQRQFHSERLMHFRDQLSSHQGVPAQVEEIVVSAHARHSQQTGQEAGQPLFNFRLRSFERVIVARVDSLRWVSEARPDRLFHARS